MAAFPTCVSAGMVGLSEAPLLPGECCGEEGTSSAPSVIAWTAGLSSESLLEELSGGAGASISSLVSSTLECSRLCDPGSVIWLAGSGRTCIILLAGYPCSLPTADLALHRLVQIGIYAASGSEGPRAPALSRTVSVALSAIIQEWQHMGQRAHNSIASLVARVTDGHGAHPAAQSWAEARQLADMLRVEVFLAPDD